MQRRLLISLFSVLITMSFQGYSAEKGGFNPDGQPPAPHEQKDGYRGITDGQHQITTKELEKLPDRTWVSLKGNIIKQNGKNEYLLRDEQGSIALIIKDNVWQGQEVKPDDLVSVNGQLMHEQTHSTIIVREIRRL
ncbi:YgiW/YdeI family stress tolerance OB fold protein [Pantoea cypripedii]|uniref:YgiW/YdeI family stress tolerance OB fold protein n=1 Tax=Pantoea cypripedii TaxID=55209 RepID=UPI001ABF610C|nr:NirD/YgiW/YdeI family stress tolerance protein [Pantoea cypripedii]